LAALALGCPSSCGPGTCSPRTTVELIPFSGRYGYGLEGPYNFAGALTKDSLDDECWKLEAQFVFPTTGYQVAEPEIRIAESYPEQVSIILHVTPPPEGAMVAQVLTTVPVTAEIPASNRAEFCVCVATDS